MTTSDGVLAGFQHVAADVAAVDGRVADRASQADLDALADAINATEAALETKVSETAIIGMTFVIRETGSGWPVRSTCGATATDTVWFIALTAASTTPTDYVAGVDFLVKPAT